MKIVVAKVDDVLHLCGIVREIRGTTNWEIVVTGVSEVGTICIVLSVPIDEGSQALRFLNKYSATVTHVSSDES